jgi:hypothetical protein
MRTRAALCLAALLAGCATYRAEPPRFTGAWPPSQIGPRPTIMLDVTGNAWENGYPRQLGQILDQWGYATERAYRESALFSDVSVARGRTDIRAQIELRATLEQNPVLAAFSYLTLLVIPNVETTDIGLITRVDTANGEPLGTVEVHGKARTWYWLPLFPIAPFSEPRTVTPSIVYDLNRDSINILHERGVF